MKPPRCFVCSVSIRATPWAKARHFSDFTLVRFGRALAHRPGWVGHPANAVWFCSDHVSLTEGLTDLPVSAALGRIRDTPAAREEKARH